MSRWLKLLIGTAAALIAGLISHGPLGRGEAFVGTIEARVNEEVRKAELPGVTARLGRDPLSREVVLTGNANDFQREGMGQLPGINDRIRAIPGISGLRWDDNDCCARRGARHAVADRDRIPGADGLRARPRRRLAAVQAETRQLPLGILP